MSINEILLESQKETQICKFEDSSISGYLLKFLTNIEGFILKNRILKNNRVDKFFSIVVEIITILGCGFFLSAFVSFTSIGLRRMFRFTVSYDPSIMIPYNDLLLLVSISLLLLIVLIQNYKSDINSITYIKTVVYVINDLKATKGKLKAFTKEIIIIFTFWIMSFLGISFISLQFIPFEYIKSIIAASILAAISFVFTYVVRVEFESNELNKILRKGTFVIISIIVTISLSFIDFQKYSVMENVWIIKIISFLLLCAFQFSNFINIVRDIYKLVLESIDKCTNIYTECNHTEITAEIKNQIECSLSLVYCLIPNYELETFSFYFNRTKRIIKCIQKRIKTNKTKRTQFYALLVITIFLFIYMSSFIFINAQYLVNKPICHQMLYILYFSLFGLFVLLICFSLIERKPLNRVIVDELVKFFNYLFPNDKETIINDYQQISNVISTGKPFLKKWVILNLIVLILVIISKFLPMVGFADLRAIVLLISLLTIPFLSYIGEEDFKKFAQILNSYTPKHIKYKIYKQTVRFSFIILLLLSLALTAIYTMFLI